MAPTIIADNLDVGDRILQWISLLFRKRNELQNYGTTFHPSGSPSAASQRPLDQITKTSDEGEKNTIR